MPEGVIHITQGYSRDHRPDLNQVILQLISEHQTGIPLWMDALSGNSSDKASFRQTLNAHLEQLRGGVGCWRRLKTDHLYRLKIDQGELLNSVLYSIGIVDQTELVLPPFFYCVVILK